MASATYPFASFGDGIVTVEFEISTANWRVSVVRCINNSDYDAIARVYLDGAQIFTAVAPANQTTTWNTTGIQLGWQPDYWNSVTEQWEPSGIDLGGYVLQTTWPWETS